MADTMLRQSYVTPPKTIHLDHIAHFSSECLGVCDIALEQKEANGLWWVLHRRERSSALLPCILMTPTWTSWWHHHVGARDCLRRVGLSPINISRTAHKRNVKSHGERKYAELYKMGFVWWYILWRFSRKFSCKRFRKKLLLFYCKMFWINLPFALILWQFNLLEEYEELCNCELYFWRN